MGDVEARTGGVAIEDASFFRSLGTLIINLNRHKRHDMGIASEPAEMGKVFNIWGDGGCGLCAELLIQLCGGPRCGIEQVFCPPVGNQLLVDGLLRGF